MKSVSPRVVRFFYLLLSISMLLTVAAMGQDSRSRANASPRTATSFSEAVVYSFTGNGADGDPQYSSVIQAQDGNYYGTTPYGGINYGSGTIFKVTPGGSLTTVYTFCQQGGECTDGDYPVAGVVQGTDGNFYGTTQSGGIYGYGTVFQVTPSGALKVLYSFCSQTDCPDGHSPGALVQGTDGNFYGTTQYGGADNDGTIFKISSTGTFTQLYSFHGTDGENPQSLLQGSNGNFYGVTQSGGMPGYGTFFSISSSGSLTTLYSFCSLANCADGRNPNYVVEGSDGNYYGTTYYGGVSSYTGVVFKVSTSGVETVFYSFCVNGGTCADGDGPQTGLVLGSDGNFYGTTETGGANNDGALFQITPAGAFTNLYSFCNFGGCTDGSNPYATPVQGSDGTFYGTTYQGGQLGYGALYQLLPSPALAPPVQLSLSANSVAVNGSVTLSWKVLNGFSDTLQQCSAFVQGGASGAGTWTGLQSGTLSGGSFNGSATIKPTAAGTYTYALTCGGQESGFATLTVGDNDALEITTSSLPMAVPGQQYSEFLTATGGTAPYTWSVSSGSLPGGLTLNSSTGEISGVTSTAGTSAFTVEAADSASHTATANLSITVYGSEPVSQVKMSVLLSQTLVPVGATITIQANVSGGSNVPTGTVQFLSNGSPLGAPVLATNLGSYANATMTETFPAGSYVITAKYSGDANFTAADASGGTLTVNAITPSFSEAAIYSFTGSGDGDPQYGSLIQAQDGNYYGTTAYGGSRGSGTVFQVTPAGSLITIYTFCAQGGECLDGSSPGAGVIQGSDGNFYGTTHAGGTGAIAGGTIFKLTPEGALTVLYDFCSQSGCADGYFPWGLVQGLDGNFYGMTQLGGADSDGTIFKISSTGTYTRLYTFHGTDGSGPQSSLVQGSDGNFYGVTQNGGAYSEGSVFKITSTGSLTTLYSFCSTGNCYDGRYPAGLVQGSDGNFYGTTQVGGAQEYGVVFKVTPAGIETPLYSFCSTGEIACTDGTTPYAGLALAGDGNFYGVTETQGVNAQGTIFQMTYAGVLNTVYDFCGVGGCTDGSAPYATPIQGSDGSIYDVTYNGGQNNDGAFAALIASPALPAPVQLSLSANSVAANSAVTLRWKVLNAFSETAQQCYGFVQNLAAGAGTWTGLQTGTLSSGVYSGSASITPTAAGTYTYALTCGGSESGFATLTVGASDKLEITTASLPVVTPEQQYSVFLNATGGTAPYTWSITSGSLPDGITLNSSSGEISGLTSVSGTLAITVQVKDSSSSPETATASYSLTVYASEPVSQPTMQVSLSQTLVPAGSVVTLEASLSGNAGIPTGTVQFFTNGSPLGSAVALIAGTSNAIAKLSQTFALGSYVITASYSGDSNYTAADAGGGTLTVSATAASFVESAVHQFTGSYGDGSTRYGNLMQALDGNYYITTIYGGTNNSGGVLRITPAGVVTSIYSFCSLANCADGGSPSWGVIQGSDGNLYGTTQTGGANSYGTIFKLTPAGVLTTLYSFCSQTSCADGNYPLGLVRGKDGNFYGTTQSGGTDNYGTIFKLTSSNAFSQIYSFHSTDGSSPQPALVQGSDGNLYGVTQSGGPYYEGTIFKITTTGTLTTLYSFCSTGNCYDGRYPAGLVQGSDGNFYGTTQLGGAQEYGVVFKVTPAGVETALYSFCNTGETECSDGANPYAGLVLGSDGNFYGTTETDGVNGQGTFFQMTYAGVLNTLYNFCTASGCTDGSNPYSTPVQGSDGSFYGTTNQGGDDYGVAYKVAATPALSAPVQLTASVSSVLINTPVTLSFSVSNAFSDSMQQCFAFVQGGATGAGSWTGQKTGTLSAGVYSGSGPVTPTAQGTYTYALTCGGVESGFVTLAVTPDLTSTTVSAAPASIAYGNSTSVTATVANTSAPASVPTGTVAFTLGSTSLGSCTLASGSCSLSVAGTSLAVGANTITVNYGGVTNQFNSSSGTTSVTLTQDVSTTTVVANPTSIFATASTSVNATVANSSSSVVPTGSVSFKQGSTSLGSCTLSSGSCSLTVQGAAIPLGSDTITAAYAGATGIAASSGTASVTVTADTTATSVAATPSTLAYSTSTSLTATVSNSSAPSSTPAGSVAFTLGSASLGSCTLTAGVCSLTVQGSALALGANSIAATFTGSSSSYLGSTGSASVTVSADSTTTAVTATPASVVESAATVIKATITDTSSSSVMPTGSVSFSAGSTSLGSCTLSAGSCSLTVQAASLALGVNSVTASYAGTTDFAASSGSASVTVTADPTTTAAAASPATISGAGSSSVSATVTDSASGSVIPTGSVSFSVGSTSLGSCTLSSGKCSVTVQGSALAAGANNIIAAYGGATGFQASSGTATLTVTADTTATTLTANPAGVFASGSTMLTAAVSDSTSPSSTPTGSITFTVNTTSLGSCTLSAGSCSLTVQASSLSNGTNSVKASYGGVANVFGVSSGTATVTVTTDVTTTAVTANPTSIFASGSTMLAAAVSDTSSPGTMPTGSVTFTDGSTTLGSCTLSAGACSLTAQGASLASGTNSVKASYAGSGTLFAASSGSATVTVTTDVTATALTANPTSILSSASTTLTATVTDTSSPTSTPTGSVTFAAGSTSLGSCTLSAGKCSITGNGSALVTGPNTITATYAGATGFAGSSGTATVTVTPATVASKTTVSASPNPVVLGQTVTISATVTGTSGTPTGSVSFDAGSLALGSANLNSSGVASLTFPISGVPTGVYSMVGTYSGNATYAASSSAAYTLTVQKITPSVAITASPNPANAGQQLTFKISVTGSGGTPTGTVSLYDGSTLLTTATLAKGAVSFAVPTTGYPAGTYALVVEYSGDATFKAASSSTYKLALLNATTTTLTASPNPVTPPASITLSATVKRPSGVAGSAAGSVDFYVGTTLLAAVPLTNGVATLTAPTSGYPAGTYAIVAKYLGDSVDAASASTAVSVKVE